MLVPQYKGINYESKENCFEKCASVKSILLYGDETAIPKPWITLLVPTYKRVDLLSQALESALTQGHCKFMWDILVLDNEPYDGIPNDTEKLIRKLNNKRIMYYRNSENIRPGDNFNRGFLLARGEYVMMLHDDDLLIANAMQRMGNYLTAYSAIGEKSSGAICASSVQFEYDAEHEVAKADIPGMNTYLTTQPMDYRVYVLTQSNVKILSHIGGNVPSNGSTYNRNAVIDAGGFNEDFGIMGDQILLFNLMKEYSIYQTILPLGFYRWGSNSMMKLDSSRQVVQNGFDFREYIYSKHLLIGKLFKKCHYKKFTRDVVEQRNRVSRFKINSSLYNDIFNESPSLLEYLFFKIVSNFYTLYKRVQTNILTKKAVRYMKKEKWSIF